MASGSAGRAGEPPADAIEPGSDAPGLADVLAVTARAGLAIRDDDAARLVAGARRVRAMAAEVRLLVPPDVEPSGPAIAPWRDRAR